MLSEDAKAEVLALTEEYRNSSSECWIWQGNLSQSGSPILSDKTPAKMAFYHLVGPGLEEDEFYSFYMGACDEKLCVKPELFKHVTFRAGKKPGRKPKEERVKTRRVVPWDRDRTLRFYYSLDNHEIEFRKEMALVEPYMCELFNVLLDEFAPENCAPWTDITSKFSARKNISEDDFLNFKTTISFSVPRQSKTAFKYLPVKRVLYNLWNENPDYMLLNGFHYISSSCGNTPCHAPWHLNASLRTPGSNNSKTEWSS